LPYTTALGASGNCMAPVLAAGLGDGCGLDGGGGGRFCGRGIGFVIGDEATADRSENNAEKELGFDRTETAFGRMLQDGDASVDDGGTGKDDGHHDGRSAFSAESEQDTESANSAGDAGDKGPEHTRPGVVPIGAASHENNERGQNGGQEVSNANEQKGFISAIYRVFHSHLPGMEKDSVNAPGDHGH
jgi:hypothetical protein